MTTGTTPGSRSVSDAGAPRAARRFEHKYLVPESLLPPLRHLLAPFMRADRHATRGGEDGCRQYVVRSIYLDTPQLSYYHETEDGIDFRAKPRIRAYDDAHASAPVFLEVKRRHGAVVSKWREAVAFAELGERPLARTFAFQLRRRALRPVLLVVYDREPYVGLLEPSLRITFDRRLRSVAWPRVEGLFDERGARPSLAGSFILEVKHDEAFGFPTWLRPFLTRHGLASRSLSKYWTCGADQAIAQAPLSARRSAALA
jgi:hypothetical protein